MSRLVLITTLLWMLLLLPACKDSSDEEKIYRVQGTLTVDGRPRTYMLNLPTDYHDDENPWGFKTDTDLNKRLYPIPTTARQLNPLLEQNDGY